MIEALEAKHYADATGEYLGAFGGERRTTETKSPETGEPVVEVSEVRPSVPAGAVEVDGPPDDAQLSRWDGSGWVALPPAALAAKKLRQAAEQINAQPEITALIEALAARLSVTPAVLAAEVAGNLAQRQASRVTAGRSR